MRRHFRGRLNRQVLTSSHWKVVRIPEAPKSWDEGPLDVDRIRITREAARSKIEALFAGAGTAGERLAAEAALGGRARLAELGQRVPPVEMHFRCPTNGRAMCFSLYLLSPFCGISPSLRRAKA